MAYYVAPPEKVGGARLPPNCAHEFNEQVRQS